MAQKKERRKPEASVCSNLELGYVVLGGFQLYLQKKLILSVVGNSKRNYTEVRYF